MDKIAVFGGTFNPFHNGHVSILDSLDQNNMFSEILIIPNYVSPLKEFDADLSYRIEMFNLLEDFFEKRYQSKITISDLELKREGVSYTYQTVQELGVDYKGKQLFFVLGTDSFFSLHQWKEPDKILTHCKLLVVRRENIQESDYKDYFKQFDRSFDEDVKLMQNPILELSSTEIRECLNSNKTIKGLVPEVIETYLYNIWRVQ